MIEKIADTVKILSAIAVAICAIALIGCAGQIESDAVEMADAIGKVVRIVGLMIVFAIVYAVCDDY